MISDHVISTRTAMVKTDATLPVVYKNLGVTQRAVFGPAAVDMITDSMGKTWATAKSRKAAGTHAPKYFTE